MVFVTLRGVSDPALHAAGGSEAGQGLLVEAHEAIVIGAGPAGLAVTASLQRERIETIVPERASVGSSWRDHYDRLHLHTVRWLSGLPGLPIDRRESRWVSRDGVVRYLERYARHHRLSIRTSVEVQQLIRDDGGWRLRTSEGEMRARSVVVATGFNREPFLPDWPGRERFAGELVHSTVYRNPSSYRGKDVLVVGTGNSGAEIAVDLAEGGAREVMISVRTPPNILRRDIAGFPSQVVGVMVRRLPVPLVDRIAAVMQRVSVGDLTRYGMPAPAAGVYTRVSQDSVPILDVGLIRLIKRRRVRVVAAVEGFDGQDVLLSGGKTVRPDSVIAATGFRRGLEHLLGEYGMVGPTGRPVVHGDRTHPNAPNLYFIGFTNPISANLREAGIDARRISRAVTRATGTLGARSA
jgi:cation diffusion facilitator CzcD-associated flavoprotein CzcO